MESTAMRTGVIDLLEQVRDTLALVAAQAPSLSALDRHDLLEATQVAAEVGRLGEAVMVRAVDAVEDQCRRALPEDSLAVAHGFRDDAALLMAVTGASRRTLTKWRQVGSVTIHRGIGSTGQLPPALPHLAQAFGAGTVSMDQALVIRQHLLEAKARAHPDDIEAAEQALVAAAIGLPAPESETAGTGATLPLPPDLLGVQARAWRDAIDPDGPEPCYEQQRHARSFTLGRRADGMWVGKLLLPPEQGEAVRLALDAHNAPRALPRFDDHCPATSGDETETALDRLGHVDERTTPQRQADTIVGLLTHAMQHAGAPRIGGEAATLVVTISEAELREHERTGGGTARLDHSGETVPAHVAARILCDGYLQACVLNQDGLPLKLGRARRTHTKHQRRAILTAYPGGCQNPGCTAPPGFTEIHHPIWWSDNGHTDTHNGIPLCQHCHTELHAGRLRCVRESSGRWHVVPSVRLRSRLSAPRVGVT